MGLRIDQMVKTRGLEQAHRLTKANQEEKKNLSRTHDWSLGD